jgi:hypothetical protein
MLDRKIDLTSIVLPNAHTAIYNCTKENNTFVGFVIDEQGNILTNDMELENGTLGYFLIYMAKDENNEHFVPDYLVDKPKQVLRIKLNTANKEISKKIFKITKILMAPWTFLLEIFIKSNKKEMITMGHINTWQITSAINYVDDFTGLRVSGSEIKLMTIDYKMEDKQANFGNIMLDY